MDEQYKVYLIGGDGNEAAIFTFDEDNQHCRLRCEYRGKTIESTSTDYFQALCDIRDLLAKDNLIPRCYGASLNVFPSGMARDMGQGLKAEKLVKGRHTRRQDLVEIFADGPDVIPASVSAQEQYWRDWLATPRS